MCTFEAGGCQRLVSKVNRHTIIYTWLTFDLPEVVDAYIADMTNYSFYDSWYWNIEAFVALYKGLEKFILKPIEVAIIDRFRLIRSYIADNPVY